MADSIAVTSLIGYRPMCKDFSLRGASHRRKSANTCWFPHKESARRKFVSLFSQDPGLKVDKLVNTSSIKALETELTREADSYSEKDNVQWIWNYQGDTDVDRRPGFWTPVNRADNPSLLNPLLRQERMGCGWLGAIFDWEGIIIEDNLDLERHAWLALAEEEGRPPPLEFVLRQLEGMKNEQAISEVLCWARDPVELKRMGARKEEIYQALSGGMHTLLTGSKELLNVLMKYNIPMALASTRPRTILETAVRKIGIEQYFTEIVAAEDVHRGKPDAEMFLYASQLLNFIPEHCIVFGNSNQAVKAAHDARMKCVAVASKHPVYELGAADLVVRRLDELSVIDLKNLTDTE